MIAHIPIVASFIKWRSFPRQLIVKHRGVPFRRLMRPTFPLWIRRLRCDYLIFDTPTRQISGSIIPRKPPRSL